MGKSIINYLSSYKTSIVLLLIYAFVLALATVIEKYGGTPVAKAFVYYSPAMFLLYGLIVANFFVTSIKYGLLKIKKHGFLVVHLSFVIIITGALVTHLFSKEGTIHLREKETTDYMVIQTNKENTHHKLPFSIELVEFTLERYPGSTSPSSYESKILIHTNGQVEEKVISMNNVLDIKGYRLFQASYDKDEQGSILSVNKDVAGRNITYAGYVLLFIGLILCFTGRNTRFRQLSRQLKQLRNTHHSERSEESVGFGHNSRFSTSFRMTLFLIIILSATTQLNAQQQLTINKEHATQFGALPMLSNRGRVEPVNTFASEILRKLHKADKIGEQNADQFILSLLSLPEMWKQIPFINYSNKDIAFNHDLHENYCSYAEMFDSNGRYKLIGDLEEAFGKPASQRNKYDKDLIKLDEQINIFHQLITMQMLSIPDDYTNTVRTAIQTGNWDEANVVLKLLSNQRKEEMLQHTEYSKIETELLYNKLNIFRTCKKGYLILGGLLLVLSFISFFSVTRWLTWGKRILISLIFVTLLYHIFGIAMRWYIAGYAPWSNSYETMVYLALISVLGGLLFVRHNSLPLALATLFGGVILFVSGLNWMNPQITPLVPVLKSPWLMIHVAVVMIAYSFFGISFLLGLTNLLLLRINRHKQAITFRIKELTIINEMSLLAGLAFMVAGVFIGAVWANESWGRYWGWDPKETWALITIIVYAMVTHLHLIKQWNTPQRFNLLSVLAFASVLMTYFGVNYLLSGMHSYN